MNSKFRLPITAPGEKLQAAKKRQPKQLDPSRVIATDLPLLDETEEPLDLDSWKAGILTRAGKFCGQEETPFDDLESAALQALRLRLVALVTERTPDFTQIKTVFGLLLDARSQQLAERKLELACKEMEEGAKSHHLTAEQLQERMKTLFGWVESGGRTEETL